MTDVPLSVQLTIRCPNCMDLMEPLALNLAVALFHKCPSLSDKLDRNACVRCTVAGIGAKIGHRIAQSPCCTCLLRIQCDCMPV